MWSARRFMVFNICVKFYENMSSGFKIMERTRKLLTERERERERELYTPWHTSYAPGVYKAESLFLHEKFRVDLL